MIFEVGLSLSDFSTMRIGGTARYFCCAKTVEDIAEAIVFAREKGLPFFVLGGGSNVLISDDGFLGVVIKNEIRGVSHVENGEVTEVTVAAGEPWDAFVADTVARGLYGLENLSGVPGTVGGSIVQNIGAYGVEIKSCVKSVDVFDTKDKTVKTLTLDACGFSYRHSFFKTQEGKTLIIVGVTFALRKQGNVSIEYKDLKNFFATRATAPKLSEVRDAVLAIRAKKFPDLRVTGTAGSFFKNPIISQMDFDTLKRKFPELPGFSTPSVSGTQCVKVSLAWILDHILHLKGVRVGAVGLHDAQPLVLVNHGTASAHDVRTFAHDVARKVREATGIAIEWEVESI